MKNYFSHDYNARNDTKLQKVMFSMGLEGIGIYWCIIEMLYENYGSLKLDECECIAFALHSDCDKIKSVIHNFDLFKIVDDVFTSDSVLTRLQIRLDKSSKAKESASHRRSNRNAVASQKLCEGNAIKEKKIKEKEIINKDIVLYNNPEFYLFLEEFIDKENPTIKYQMSKNENYLNSQAAELDKLIKDGYSLESIKTVLNFIKQDEFRKKQILSIKKLREKNKEGVPYIIIMIEKIKQWKPPKQSIAFIPGIYDNEGDQSI